MEWYDMAKERYGMEESLLVLWRRAVLRTVNTPIRYGTACRLHGSSLDHWVEIAIIFCVALSAF